MDNVMYIIRRAAKMTASIAVLFALIVIAGKILPAIYSLFMRAAAAASRVSSMLSSLLSFLKI